MLPIRVGRVNRFVPFVPGSMLVPPAMRRSGNFASTIRNARALLGCSSAELARLLEISASTLARWEAGRQQPDLERQHDVVRRLRALTRLQRHRR
jgi:ribosome-binding protein aMBF1 (putative translation factor)